MSELKEWNIGDKAILPVVIAEKPEDWDESITVVRLVKVKNHREALTVHVNQIEAPTPQMVLVDELVRSVTLAREACEYFGIMGPQGNSIAAKNHNHRVILAAIALADKTN